MSAKQTPLPGARELEIDAAAQIAAIVDFLRREHGRAGRGRAVLGVSGGTDSALVAVLAARALGPGSVTGFYLPYRTSDPGSRPDAEAAARCAGIDLVTVEISGPVDAFFESFPEADRLRRGNRAARERMCVLYDQAKHRGALVLGTGNRSETLLGYTTLHGDAACDLAPLAGLYKTQVWRLAEAAGVPAGIVAKPPSADLWPGQTDEGEMGLAYREVDRLLVLMVDGKKADRELVDAGFSADYVSRVRGMVTAGEFKRRPPPVPEMPGGEGDRGAAFGAQG